MQSQCAEHDMYTRRTIASSMKRRRELSVPAI